MKSTGGSRTVPGVLRLFWVGFLVAFAAQALAADAALPCPPQLRPAVNFWIRVYTQIDTNAGFLHDPNNLSVVYETVHFAPGSSPWERQRIVNAERDRLAAELRSIAAGVRPLTPQERHILALWGPHVSAARLREAADDIRFQLGQSNRFRAGLIRSGAWHHAIARALAEQGLPAQLAALPLVESSYNPRAYSKDGAAGLWQFMPGTARPFLRIGAAIDQRFDPFSATVAAAQLLAYNYRVLGTWPLAITAYNQGVAGMLRAVHTLGTRNIATIVARYHAPTFGFASRNFYVSFLAALYVEQHAQRYFGHLHRLPEEHFHEVTLPGYVSVASIEGALGVTPAKLRELNPALLPPVWDGELDVPKGYRLRLPESGPDWSVAQLTARLGPQALLAAQLRPPVYRVRWGDTLSGIAARYHLDIWALARFNGMPVNGVLRAGERLRLPGVSRPPLQLAAAAGPPVARPAVYRVQPGDTLSGIAAHFGVNPGMLARLNDLPLNGVLRIGEPLHLPGSGAPGALLAAAGAAPAVRPAVYRVHPGDTLSGIAVRFGVSPWVLARLNDLPLNGVLRIGEPLHLPGSGAPGAQLAAAGAAPAVQPAVYRVHPGDTLSGIAVRFGVSPWVLARLNDIALNSVLRIGEPLHLPGSAATLTADDIPAATHALRPPAGTVLAANTAADRLALPPAASRLASGPNQALADARLGTPGARADSASDPQPVSANQAEALGPMLGPEGVPADSVDPTDYTVAPDGTIRVAAAESLGYYAEWLNVSAMDLRRINHLAFSQPVRIGERIRLDFRHVTPQQFEQRRIAYHRALEASYFASHRIDGTRTYVTRSGDSLWTLTQRFDGLPAWLLRQYNPNTDFFTLHPGTQLVIPRIVPTRAAG